MPEPNSREVIRARLRLAGLTPQEIDFALRVISGESSFDPNVRVSDPATDGSPGFSHGLFQLRSPGLLDEFIAQGFTDWRDVGQQIEFVARYVQTHRGDGFGGWGPWTVAQNLIANGVSPTEGFQGGLPDIPAEAGGGFETPEERRERLEDEVNAQITFLREEERLANIRGDRASARDFANQIAVLERQLAAQRSEAALDREFEGEQGALNRELQLRLQRLSDANRLTETLAGLQAQARDLIVETMGRDPFRGAVRAQGGVGAGITPLESFRSELRGVAAADIPQVGADATLPEIEATIEEQQGLIEHAPTAPIGIPGLKHGGIIDMERDGNVFRVKPRGEPAFDAPAGAGILVGESGKEVIRRNANGQIEIIPLVASAAHGATLGDDEGRGGLLGLLDRPGQLSTEVGAFQGLRPFFEAASFSGEVPFAQRIPPAFGGLFGAPQIHRGIGEATAAPGRTSEIFQQLGTQPRLIYVPELDSFFSVDPSGQTELIGDAQRLIALQGNPTNAFTVPIAEAKERGLVVGLNTPQRQESLAFQETSGQFGAQQPIFSPFTRAEQRGLFLPDPALLASVWQTLDPDTKRLAISAYGLGGVSEDQFERRIRFFTPGSSGARATALLR